MGAESGCAGDGRRGKLPVAGGGGRRDNESLMTDTAIFTGRLADCEATLRLSERFARIAQPGVTLLLHGHVGAGKTFFARAVIQTLLARSNLFEDVPSPTFTLVQIYHTSGLEIWHADLYRLTSGDDIIELGLDAAMENAFCLVEWPDRLQEDVPDTALHLTFSVDPENPETGRRFELRGPKALLRQINCDDPQGETR